MLISPILRATVGLLVLAALAGCSKDLPSSPGTPPGEPVLLQGNPTVNASREVTIDGNIINQSGRTIYLVQIGMTTYRDDPFFANLTDTSEVKIDSLLHGERRAFSAFRMKGDRFIEAFPVYTYFRPGTQ
jgi:hypothetical protein